MFSSQAIEEVARWETKRRMRVVEWTATLHPVARSVRKGGVEIAKQNLCAPHPISELGLGQELAPDVIVIQVAHPERVLATKPLDRAGGSRLGQSGRLR